ncbi:MAG: hypothetical protein ACODAC_01780 [Pseudomonadota bacterium]
MRYSLVLIVLLGLLGQAPAWAQTAGSGDAMTGNSERELIVRFSRAYGMAKGAFDEHTVEDVPAEKRDALLREPEKLDDELQEELGQILDLNGLEPEEWQQMFARMDRDDRLRQRIDSLSVPFGTQ